MDDVLPGSRTMKSMTSRGDSIGYFASNSGNSSEILSIARQPPSAACADCGSKLVDKLTSSIRAVFSARST